jgi:hypothetical protein
MKKDAVISECKKYRYTLSRTWEENKPGVVFLMLNPSTADAALDDPTIRRCIGFAKSWGFGSLTVLNLFAYRATNPKELLLQADPVGPLNGSFLHSAFQTSSPIICAWGNSSIVDRLLKQVKNYFPLYAAKLERLAYLDLSVNGTPKHPLYLPGDTELKTFLVQKKIHLIGRFKTRIT